MKALWSFQQKGAVPHPRVLTTDGGVECFVGDFDRCFPRCIETPDWC